MSINIYFWGVFLKTRENKSHKNSFVFGPIFDCRGVCRGSAGRSADNVYFHPDTSKFDVVNVYIHAGGGDQGHHTRMGGGYIMSFGEHMPLTFWVIDAF